MIDPEAKLVRNERVVFRGRGEGALLLHQDSGAYHGINEVGAAIWELLGSEPTLGVLVANLAERLDDPPPNLSDDVEEFLEQLAARDLIEVVPRIGAP
jgi:hypothetical protein